MEMSKNIPPAEYPQIGNNPPPPQQYQSPPGYNAQQYPPATEPQTVQIVMQQPQIINASQQNTTGTQSYFVFSVVTLVISVVGCLFVWPALFCTIPALIYSILSKDYSSRGELESARVNGKVALILNIVAVISIVILLIINIAWIATVA